MAGLRTCGDFPRVAPVADYADAEYFGTYLPLLVMTIVGVLLVTSMFLGNRLLRPTASTTEKLLTYECGVDPVGEGWAQNHVRYYVFAYLYVIFAVDAVFLFPWATVFAGLGWVSVAEMGIFVGFIAVAVVGMVVNDVPLVIAAAGTLFTIDAVALFFLPRLVGFPPRHAAIARHRGRGGYQVLLLNSAASLATSSSWAGPFDASRPRSFLSSGRS